MEVPQSLPRSRAVTVVGWICLVLGASSPLRIGLNLSHPTLRMYTQNALVLCVFDLVLSVGTVAAGWGLIRRLPWGPLASALVAGATIALSIGSLGAFSLITAYSISTGSPDTLEERLVANGSFLLINSTMLLGWIAALRIVVRAREEFASPYRPWVLIGWAVLSGTIFLAVCYLVWITVVL